MQIKILTFILFLLYQTNSFSNVKINNQYNQEYLSDYFSAILSYANKNNRLAIRYFESSKTLLMQNSSYFDQYISSLVIEGKVKKAIKKIKTIEYDENNDLSFETNLLFYVNEIKKNNFESAEKILDELKNFNSGNLDNIVISSLKNFNYTFLSKKIKKNVESYGNLTAINRAFQSCYLNSNSTSTYFENLINLQEGDYSRYYFFYLAYLKENNQLGEVKRISSTIDILDSNLLISQAKQWIDQNNFDSFSKYFLCSSEQDLISEFFYLVSSLYSSQKNFKKSDFYLNLSNFLNKKFYFNLTLLIENNLINKQYITAEKYLKDIKKENEVYYWYKIKKKTKIISNTMDDSKAINYLQDKFRNFKDPSTKMIYDMANFYKNKKKYKIAIDYYSELLNKIESRSSIYADILYKRGGCLERIGKYTESDSDLLNALEFSPEDPYVLNYLGYSWLERGYKIEEAIKLLELAYNKKKNDPYIIDSIGWGYYLIGNYQKAETYLIKAVQLMPDDPIVNDHYGDILWKLNRKLQAKYFWRNTIKLDDVDEKLIKKISIKLLKGINS